MSRRRLVAIDVDGTLVGDSLQISAVDRDAIRRAIEADVDVCLATGRLFSAARPYAEELHASGYLIPLNGAAVYDVSSRTCVHATPLDPAAAAVAVDALRDSDFRVQLYFDDTVYLDGMDDRSAAYVRRSRVVPVIVPDLRALLVGPAPATRGPFKVLGISTPDEVERMIRHLGDRIGERANVFRSMPEYLEVTDRKADKGAALAWVAKHLGVETACVAAIGDSDNDVPMFERAGHSFVVAGGTPLARARAGRVVGPQGVGVSEALAEFLDGAYERA